MKRTLLTASLLALHCGVADALDNNVRELRHRGMKFGEPLLTTELSGSMGAATASKARGGVRYFRTRVRPSNPNSSQQTVMRSLLSGIAAAWKNTLTSPQRAAWSAIASEAESGIDVFAASNSINMLAGHARVDTAPASKTLPWIAIPDLSLWTMEIDTTNLIITGNANGSTYLAATTSRFLIFLETGIQKPSRLRQQYPFRFAGYATSSAIAHPTITVDLTHFTELAAVAEGQQVWLRLVGVNDPGQVTGEIKALMTVAAV